MGRNLEKRLRIVEQQVARIREKDCNCHAHVALIQGSEEEFRAEMNRTCPAHGFRELNVSFMILVQPDPPGECSAGRVTEDPEALLQEYYRRLAEAKRAA